MNVGIVVEDNRDGLAYSELIRKIRDDIENTLAFPCHGVSTLLKEFLKGLNYFKYGAPHSIDKALVIMDSDCSDASVWEVRLKQICERSHFVSSFPGHFHATKCALETCLLPDANAMNQASQVRR